MARHSREIVSEVLAANDIVDVLGAYLELKPAGGGRFKALCPFHQEKTPSFSVSRDRQMYYCFGCGKHGDALSFLCEHDGMSFREALEKLAERGGIRLPALKERDDPKDLQRAQLLELGKFAAKLFVDTLNDALKGGTGRVYLKTRQLKPETVRRFGLGYAPDSWNTLTDGARAAGFKDTLLEASGLARSGERGSLYDFFRNRLMVPIRDVSGNVVAFGGRILESAGTSAQPQAKYINTPENAVYKKSRILYGLHEAREAVRREKCAILVEGYFDLLRCFDAGIENVVASCGTALTAEQAALIRRYAPEVVVVFDNDIAGIRAAVRGVGILTAAGPTVRALVLPDGKDPDDYVKEHGADAFRGLVRNALDFVTFYVRVSQERLATIEGRTEVAKELFALLVGVNDELRREEYLKRAARELGLNEWTLRAEFGKFVRGIPERVVISAETKSEAKVSADDRDFLASVLASEPLRRKAQQALTGVALVPGAFSEVLTALLHNEGPGAADSLPSEAARSLYAAAANSNELPPEKAEILVEKRIASLKKEALAFRAAPYSGSLRKADEAKDLTRQKELLAQTVRIIQEKDRVGYV